MPKPVSDNISNYYCLCCVRRFDLHKESYHKQFFEIKRVSLNDLVLMIEEGKKHVLDSLSGDTSRLTDGEREMLSKYIWLLF